MPVGPPSDATEWTALLTALLVALSAKRPSFFAWGSQRTFRLVCAVLATGLSALYVLTHLRGGPRIIDASTYYLEGRALSEGHLSFALGDVPSSTMGRFLVRDSLARGTHAAGIFPPGYPAVLALGFLLGIPLAVGPLLGGAVAWLTFDLGEEAAARVEGLSEVDRALVPRLAAVLSVVCAALRYHTADTMSHGLAAVCLVASLVAALRLRRARGDDAGVGAKIVHAALLGLALGWLVATRPVSGAAGAILVSAVLGREALRWRTFVGTALGATFPLVLFALHQRAATGAWLVSSQGLYYAVSDGPAGCFGYGFGARIGCHLEHGDFVAHNLPRGYGPKEALFTTLRRLKMHLGDALDAAPLAVVTAAAMAAGLRRRELRPLALSLPVFALAYAPFYFDGNYPGGGARFFADQLPVEHVLVALFVPTISRWARERRPSLPSPAGLATLLVASALAGFAFFTGHEHALLRDREGGAPMYEPSRLAARGISSGLVFVDTDHGFALGFDPDARADRGVEVARFRGDASDRWLWESRGRPAAYRYRYSFDPAASERATLSPFEPPPSDRLEAESLWPPLAQDGGYAVPRFDACATGGVWLAYQPEGDGHGITLALPKRVGGARVTTRIRKASASKMHLWFEADGVVVRELDDVDGTPTDGPCGASFVDLPPVALPAGAASLTLGLRASGSEAEAGVDSLRIEENR